MHKGNHIFCGQTETDSIDTEIPTLSDQVSCKVSQTLVNTFINITVIVDVLE